MNRYSVNVDFLIDARTQEELSDIIESIRTSLELDIVVNHVEDITDTFEEFGLFAG